MEQEKLHFVHKEGFVFAGAIFMSNRATKLECFQRKIFGLPQSKAKFMEQVKTGMILFLFEHEERKLYGVFEATSDGALNIIPDAFRSTGQSYPAQICCKRILTCRPLCEDEFRSAIQDNYYSPNKFHFGLSYDQVTNLIHLFYSTKSNLKQHQKPVTPNRIIRKPENSAAENFRLTEVGSYAERQSDEYSREGNWQVRRDNTLHQSPLNLPMHYTVTDTGRGSNQVNMHAHEPQPSRSQHLYSEPFDSCSSLFIPNDRAPLCHFSTGKQCSTTEDMYYNKPLPQDSDRYMTKFDSGAVPYSMGPHHYSSPDIAACMIPRQIKIQEPHVFESLRVVADDGHQTAVLQRTSVYGAQPKQLFKFPDYIPLPKDLQQEFVREENLNSGEGNFECASSAAFRSCIPNTGKEISEAFYMDDDDELKIYPRLVSDDYPIVSRVSVFSRLSRGQNVCNPKTPESPTSLPLNQLLNTLRSRREQWSTTEASKQYGKRGGGDQYDRTVSTELFDQSCGRQDKFAAQPGERSKADQYELITETESVGFDTSLDYDQGIELSEKGSFELPFYNFRRRNIRQNSEVQDDLNTGSKRRRLLRPSLYEDQIVKGKDNVKALSPMISEDEKENKANCLKSELEGESVPSFVHPETELKTLTLVISEHKTESKVSSFQTHQKSELEVESVPSFVLPETEVKTPIRSISENETESKVPGFQIRQKSELEFESVSSFVRPEIELMSPSQVILEHRTESKVPDFQSRQKYESEVESVSSFVCPETELTPAQVIPEYETESKVPGFQTSQKLEMQGESVSSFLCPETELKPPTQAFSKHETESKVPGFQTSQKLEMPGESDSSFLCTETELKPPTQAISKHDTESKVPGFQSRQKYESEVESVSSFVCPETELTPTQVISKHETESKVPDFQTNQKLEKQGESVSSFLCPETELKPPTQAISKHETESKVPGFHTHQKSEMPGESDSSFLCPETELKPPTQAISKRVPESKVPGFQTRQKSEMPDESDSSFLCPQIELKPLSQAISERETEIKIPIFQAHQKSKFEGESVEGNAVTSVLESEDYIPLD